MRRESVDGGGGHTPNSHALLIPHLTTCNIPYTETIWIKKSSIII